MRQKKSRSSLKKPAQLLKSNRTSWVLNVLRNDASDFLLIDCSFEPAGRIGDFDRQHVCALPMHVAERGELTVQRC